MKCETCQALLVDFVSGELSGSTRASATTHIASCTRCQGDVQKLREGLDAAALLPVLPPPASVRAHVLEAAARANARPRSGDVGKKRTAGASWWWRVLSRFGELATSPQVAMATVLLLMIAVGTYYLPASDDAPTAALSPLDPDALEAERSEAPAATASSLPGADEAPEEEALEEESMTGGQPPAAPARQRKPRARSARKGAAADRAAFGAEAKKEKRSQKASSAPEDGVFAKPAPARAGNKRRAAPTPFPALAEREDEADMEASPAARDEGAVGTARAAGSAGAPTKQTAPLAPAKAAFEARDYAAAARLAEAALENPGVDINAARWIAARSHRAAGDCRSAMPHFTILRSTTRRFPRAWIEGALCLQKLGDTTAANTWLSEAEQMPAVSSEAKRLRARFGDEAL